MPHKPPQGIQRRLFRTGGTNPARHTRLFKSIKSGYFAEIEPKIIKELERLPVEIIDPEFRSKQAPLVLGHILNIMNNIITEQIIAKMKLNEHQRKQLSKLARRHVELISMHPKKMYLDLMDIPNEFHLPSARKKINEALNTMKNTSRRKRESFGSPGARRNFEKEWNKTFVNSSEDAMVPYKERDIVMLQNVVDLKIEELLRSRKKAVDFITEIEWIEDILSSELKELIKERKIKMHGSGDW